MHFILQVGFIFSRRNVLQREELLPRQIVLSVKITSHRAEKHNDVVVLRAVSAGSCTR